MKNYSIYKITNRINGKIYIGQTSRGLSARWREHVYRSKNNICNNHFKRAIRKHGSEAFAKEVLIDNLTADLANRYEELYIELYDTFNFGYNSTRGGDNMEMTIEARKKLSKAMKGENNPMYGLTGEKHHMHGKARSEETKQKMSEARKGEKNPMYGKTFSKEHRQKISKAGKGRILSPQTRKRMSEAQKGRTVSEEAKRKISEATTKIPVIGVNKTTGKVRSFASTLDAERTLKVCNSNIARAARKNSELSPTTGTTYSAGEWYFFYFENC